MALLFSREVAEEGATQQDPYKLHEIDTHEILAGDYSNKSKQIATFDQIMQMGSWFLSQKFNCVIPSDTILPSWMGLLQKDIVGPFWGKVALGKNPEDCFPITAELIQTDHGPDIRIQIVPIHFGALEISQFGKHTDSLLALAAAAAVAPQFVLALESGISTTSCSKKRDVVSSITPDHGTPLAITFDAFTNTKTTLATTIQVTQTPELTIKEAAHLHGKSKPDTQLVTGAAAASKIAAGVPIHTLLRSQLPRHVLFIQTKVNEQGIPQVIGIDEALFQSGIQVPELAFFAAALGFTARVVGDSAREQIVQKILSPKTADTPLHELFV